jgi:hypothetical protein
MESVLFGGSAIVVTVRSSPVMHCELWVKQCPLWANSGHFTSQLYHPMQSQLAIKQTGTMLRAIPRTGVAGLAQITIQSDSRPL